MKILIRNESGASNFIYRGFGNEFIKQGHQVYYYDPNQTSVFRIFSQVEPNLYWGEGYHITPAEIKCCNNRPNLRVMMKVGFWGRFSDEVDRNIYQTGPFADENEIRNVLSLKNLKLVWGYGPTSYTNFIIGHWSKHIKTHSILPAADPQVYYPVESQKDYHSDLYFCGGMWDYKKSLQWLVKLCQPVGKYNIKINGGSHWNVSQYMGAVTEDEQRIYQSSAKICPNLSEPHAVDYGFEVNERTFKLGSSHCFVISDYVQGLVDLFPDSVVFCKTFDEFDERVDYYLRRPEERQEYANRLYREVMTNHTYENRVKELLEILGE